MKKFMLVTLLLGASVFIAMQCSQATVEASGQANAPAGTQENEKIDYSAPPNAPFTAEEVTVNAKGYTLAGTLLLPKSGARPFPAVITITGSGQQTRDE